jgi:hypothetical protein
MSVTAGCIRKAHREYTKNREEWQEKLPRSAGPWSWGMRKRPKRCQKKGSGLPPSVTLKHYRLNAYDYRAFPESFRGIIRLANSAKVWRFRTRGRLYLYETLLERLAQDLQDMTAEFGPFV